MPVDKRHLDMVYSHIRYSDKPFMGSVTAPERAQDTVDMAKIVFGDEFVDQNCVIISLINANSPLVFDGTMVGALKVYARANQATVISPFILSGAMSAVTAVGTLTQILAEASVWHGLRAALPSRCTGGVRHIRQLDLHAVRSADLRHAGARPCSFRRWLSLPAARRSLPLGRRALRLEAARMHRLRMRAPTLCGRPFSRALISCFMPPAGSRAASSRAMKNSSSMPTSLSMLQRFADGVDYSENGQALSAIREVGPGKSLPRLRAHPGQFRNRFLALDRRR